MKDAAIIVLLLIILALAAFDEQPATALIDDVTASKVNVDWHVCKVEPAPPLPLQRPYQNPRIGGVA